MSTELLSCSWDRRPHPTFLHGFRQVWDQPRLALPSERWLQPLRPAGRKQLLLLLCQDFVGALTVAGPCGFLTLSRRGSRTRLSSGLSLSAKLTRCGRSFVVALCSSGVPPPPPPPLEETHNDGRLAAPRPLAVSMLAGTALCFACGFYVNVPSWVWKRVTPPLLQQQLLLHLPGAGGSTPSAAAASF